MVAGHPPWAGYRNSLRTGARRPRRYSDHTCVARVGLVLAVVLAGCGSESTKPGASLATASPQPFFDDGGQLAAYAAQRRATLVSLAASKPKDLEWGSTTLFRPMGPTELRLMLARVGIDSNYAFNWIEPGTGVSGGANAMQMAEQLAQYPGMRITYVRAIAPLETLLLLSQDERVWLVDVGGTEDYYELAHRSGLIP